MDPALLELFSEGTPDDEVAVILRLADPFLTPDGVRVVTRFGNIATVRLRRGDIPDVWSQTPILSMKAAKLYGPTPTLDDAVPGEPLLAEALSDLEPRPGDQRRPDGDLPSGDGVVVAHIDWGLDFAHPDFRHPDGRTRVLALWDQSQLYDPARPNHYGYGRVYEAAEIDRALAAADPYGALGYHPAATDPGRGCHGTHTMGISAGNGQSGGPIGLAPEAALMFVHLSTPWQGGGPGDPAATGGPSPLGNSVAFLEALDFFAQTAGSRPFVVNASLGRQAGQHDGKTLTEQGMDAFLLAAPGRAIVQSTGNYFDRGVHATGVLHPGQSRTLHLNVESGGILPNEVDLWYPGVDRFGVVVRGPQGVLEASAEPGHRVQVMMGGNRVGNLYHRIGDPNNGDNQVTLVLSPAAPGGRWDLLLFGREVANGRFHAWVERTASRARRRTRFSEEDDDPTSTLGTICNGLRTLAVGAYDAHSSDRALARFSSAGPTRDFRELKPELVAPGVRVLAARSRPRMLNGDAPLLVRMNGTSMAAPHVAGTIALMFAAAGRPLTVDETRRLLLAHADPLRGDADLLERLRLGSGYLNTAAAVAAAKQAGQAGQPSPTLSSRVQETAAGAMPAFAAMAHEGETHEAWPEDESEAMSGEQDAIALQGESTDLAEYADNSLHDATSDTEEEEEEEEWVADEEEDAEAAARRDYRTRQRQRSTPPRVKVRPRGSRPARARPIHRRPSPLAVTLPLAGAAASPTASPAAPTAAPAAPAATVPAPPVEPPTPPDLPTEPAVPPEVPTAPAAAPGMPIEPAAAPDMPTAPAAAPDVPAAPAAEPPPVTAAAPDLPPDVPPEATEAQRDHRARYRRGSALPFQFQIPLTGGPPALAVPIGGRASPFAVSLPLGGAAAPTGPAAPPAAPTAPPGVPAAAPGAPAATPGPPAAPAAAVPAAPPELPTAPTVTPELPTAPAAAPDLPSAPAAELPPVTVAAADFPLYVPPEAADGVHEAMQMPGIEQELALHNDAALPIAADLGPAEPEAAEESAQPDRSGWDPEAELGERVLAAALSSPGSARRRSSSAVLRVLADSAVRAEDAEAVAGLWLGPLDRLGYAPSATALFNSLIDLDDSMRPRAGLRRILGERFRVLARPGEPLGDVQLRPGDLLVRVARGEGWGHVAIVASPRRYRREELANARLHGEGYPQLIPGRYVHVVEVGPRLRTESDRFARRLCDAADLVLPDTLLVRILPQNAESGEAAAEERSAAPGAPGAGAPAPLRKGASGDAVRRAQRALNRIHADAVSLGLPGLPGCPLPEDGRFGSSTETAVIALQQQVLSDPSKWDGVIGPETWAQLTLLAGSGEPAPQRRTAPARQPVRSGRAAAIAAEATEWVESASARPGQRPTLRLGSRGAAVAELQGKLNRVHAGQSAAGAPGLAACPLTEDGAFGTRTREAVVSFQRLAFSGTSRAWDGVVGPNTWAALDGFAGAPSPVPPTPPIPPGPPSGPTAGVVAAGREVVATVPLLRGHVGTAPDLILRWNRMASVPAAVDLAIHLHGFSGRGVAMRLEADMEPVSGLDFHNPDAPAESGRVEPTLCVLPRGNYYGGASGEGYNFPALIAPDGLRQLIEFALARFATRIGAAKVAMRRLLLTAHSGGGAALMRILGSNDPDEVHVFDALYTDPVALVRWASARLARPDAASSALRVLYIASTKTAPHSQAVARALRSLPLAGAALRRFRVEATSVGHRDIARRFGWRLLRDAGADLPLSGGLSPTPPQPAPPGPPTPSSSLLRDAARAQWEAHPRVHRWFGNSFDRYVMLAPLYAAKGIPDAAAYLDANTVSLTLFGHRQDGHRDLVAPLRQAEEALRGQTVAPAITSFGCLVPRPIRGTTDRLSNHALGRAIDLNPTDNPRITRATDFLVIAAMTGADIRQETNPTTLSRRSRAFQDGFSDAWVASQTRPEILAALQDRGTRERLDRYARHGFCTLYVPLIEALIGAGFGWGGAWRSSKDFMHFELA